jgi:MinD-like ATPase involved in chromosome partitioning or flagellar assembly
VGLANVASILAQRGHNVGCIDLDLEAPGLASVFHLALDPGGTSVIDLFQDPNPAKLADAIIDVRATQRLPFKGKLLFVGASDPAPSELNIRWSPRSLQRFNENVLTPFRTVNGLDFLFIDSRSGLSPAATTGVLIGSRALIFTRLDRQSVTGTYHVNRVLRGIGGANFEVKIVVNEFHSSGRKSKEAARIFEARVGSDTILATIPFDESLSIEEEILVNNPKRSGADPVLRAYSKIADALSNPPPVS